MPIRNTMIKKYHHPFLIQSGCLLLRLALAAMLFSPIISFAEQQSVTITLEHKNSLRTLAKQYFGTPDDWKIILYHNGFQNPEDLPPKASLVIPVQLYKDTAALLRKARKLSRLASMEGARLLARPAIEKAIQLQQDALKQKNRGKLEEALKIAQQAVQAGKTALSEAQKKKLRSVSAILASWQGKVQSRKPEQSVWNHVVSKQELIEKERIRTLSDSRAHILFVDGSTLKLDANALAVIGMMRENRVKRSFKTDVTILKGDVFLLMASLGRKNKFNIHTPGVETDIRSRKFRASRDTDHVTRFSNYDGEINVKAQGHQVLVKKNEGVRINPGRQPGVPRRLLPPPQLTTPTANQVLLSTDVRFTWQAVESARSYKLEISGKRNFTAMIKQEELTQTDYHWKAPQRGVYYFRIYTIDNEGLAGPYSRPVPFSVNTDIAPPYLAVHAPLENAVVLADEVNIQGLTEGKATLAINGHEITVADDNSFNHRLKLVQGEQTIVIQATDPAGFQTVVKRRIRSLPDEQLLFLDVPPLLTVNKTAVPISGRIRPHTRIEIDGRPVTLAATFSYIAELDEGAHTLTIKASAPPDKTQVETVKVNVDLTPPVLVLEKISAYQSTTAATLSGHVSEDALVTINAQPVALADHHFESALALKEGQNLFEIIARDTAGNQTRKRVALTRDTEAPRKLRQTLSKTAVQGGESVALAVEAQDNGVGLARTGHFAIAVDKQQFHGILKLNSGGDLYEGNIFVPPGVKGPVRVQHIRIRDRMGNELKWESGK